MTDEEIEAMKAENASLSDALRELASSKFSREEYFSKMYVAMRDLRRVRDGLKESLPGQEEIALDLARERAKNKLLRRDIRIMQEAAEKRNLQLDALHYVWCSGPCRGGWHRHGNGCPLLTGDVVSEAVRSVRRIVSRWAREERQAGRDPSEVYDDMFGDVGSLPTIFRLQERLQEAEDKLEEIRRDSVKT